MIDFIRKRDGLPIPFNEKKVPKKITHICSCCSKIHVDKKSWQQLEFSLSENPNTALSHGLCPHCYEEQRTEFMKFKSRSTFEQSIARAGYS